MPCAYYRSVFITWLRENTDCPEVLKSAAHSMKHRPETQVDITHVTYTTSHQQFFFFHVNLLAS